MTMLELIARRFPLHYQRIVEATFAEDYVQGHVILTRDIDDKFNNPLAHLFLWADTSEGHEYWLRLDGATMTQLVPAGPVVLAILTPITTIPLAAPQHHEVVIARSRFRDRVRGLFVVEYGRR